jgi:hypothetical protein
MAIVVADLLEVGFQRIQLFSGERGAVDDVLIKPIEYCSARHSSDCSPSTNLSPAVACVHRALRLVRVLDENIGAHSTWREFVNRGLGQAICNLQLSCQGLHRIFWTLRSTWLLRCRCAVLGKWRSSEAVDLRMSFPTPPWLLLHLPLNADPTFSRTLLFDMNGSIESVSKDRYSTIVFQQKSKSARSWST